MSDAEYDALWSRFREEFGRGEAGVSKAQRLGEAAVRIGWLSQEQLENGLREPVAADPEKLAQLLSKQGWLTGDRARCLRIITADTPADASALGCFGRYQIRGLLGEGGMAKVFLASDPALKREVALKIPAAGTSDRWTREVQALARLQHPNIVEVYDVGEAGGIQYFAMERVAGETLGSAWTRWDLKKKVAVLRQVAAAVAHAHAKGVIHRDLKPGNVLMAEGDVPKVSDFGLASIEGDPRLTHVGDVIGTPYYMAPEQVCGEPGTAAGDVYSLGVILYEALTGRVPFRGQQAKDVYHKILFREPLRPRKVVVSVPADLETICVKAMAKEKDRRYASARALEEDLQRWLSGEPILARPPSLLYRWRIGILRRKGAATLLVSCVLVFLAASAWAASKWRQKERELLRQRKKQEARERALVPLDSGRRILEEMRLCLRDRNLRREEFFDLGRKAEREFGTALEVCPDHEEAWLGLGRTYEMTGDTDRALVAVEKSIAAAPTFSAAHVAHLRILVEHYERRLIRSRSGEGDEPTNDLTTRLNAAFEKSRQCAKEHWELPYAEGIFAFGSGNFAEAERLLGIYLRTAPADALARDWRGHALVHLERYDEAIEELASALTGNVWNWEAYFYRAMARSAKGDVEGAIADYSEVIRLDPASDLACLKRSKLHEKAGRIDAAIADHDEAIRRNPVDANTFFHRGLLHLEKRAWDRAEEDFAECLRLAPENIGAYGNRARVRLALGRPQEAIDDLSVVVRSRPELPQGYFDRGRAWVRLKKYPEALEDFSAAVRLAPEDPEGYVNRGEVRQWMGDRAGATSDFETALRIAPQDWSYRANVEKLLERVR